MAHQGPSTATRSPSSAIGVLAWARSSIVQLVGTLLALAGVVLILLSRGLRGGLWYETLFGVGAGLIPSGLLLAIQSHFVDRISQHLTRDAIRNQIHAGFREHFKILASCSDLGLDGLYPTRHDALDDIAGHIDQEFSRARNGDPHAKLWIIGTSLVGFLHPEAAGFDPARIMRSAAELAAQGRLDLRILMVEPRTAAQRDRLERRLVGSIAQEIRESIQRLQHDFGIRPEWIKLYKGTPTVFGIATSDRALLNPYPVATEAHRCFSVLVRKTVEPTPGQKSRDIYGQYIRGHFRLTWNAAVPLEAPGATASTTRHP